MAETATAGRVLGTPTGEVDEPFHTLADIARAVGVSAQSTGRWYKAHAEEVPVPSIDIPMANGDRMRIWTAEDAAVFVAVYRGARGF